MKKVNKSKASDSIEAAPITVPLPDFTYEEFTAANPREDRAETVAETVAETEAYAPSIPVAILTETEIEALPLMIDTTSKGAESPAERFKRDVASLVWARSIRQVSLTDYLSGSQGEDDRIKRKRDWNNAKSVELRINKASALLETMALSLSVRLNGNHAIKGKTAPIDGSVSEHVAETEKRGRLEIARAILATGNGADSLPSDSLSKQALDDLAFCAKQDGHIREPHKAALFIPREAILTFTDSGKWVADKKAAHRWIQWRDVEILMQTDYENAIIEDATPFNK